MELSAHALPLIAVLLAASPAVTPAAAPTGLTVGDRAPAIAPAVWLNGRGVPRFRKGTVYLVDFWATWCFPCRQSIPHLNQLQQIHGKRGLQVLGVAAVESGVAGLQEFVAHNHIEYPVAYVADDRQPWAWRDRPNGMPLVFIVDRGGQIAWWGEPRGAAFDAAIERAVTGS